MTIQVTLTSKAYDPILGQFITTETEVTATFQSAVATVPELPTSGNTLYDARVVLDDNHLFCWNGTVWVDTGIQDVYDYVVDESIPGQSPAMTFKESVENEAALPLEGNSLNDGRITDDTQNLYIWNGTQWVDQGDIIDFQWSAISDKPTSPVIDIDDAVSKKHTQNTDTYLNQGGPNEVSAANAKSAVTLKHTQGTDQKLDSGGPNEVSAANVKLAVLHKDLINNPHSVDADDVGLGNVDNTSDLDKPVSTATQAALDVKVNELSVLTSPLLSHDCEAIGSDQTGRHGIITANTPALSTDSKFGTNSIWLKNTGGDFATITLTNNTNDFQLLSDADGDYTYSQFVKVDGSSQQGYTAINVFGNPDNNDVWGFLARLESGVLQFRFALQIGIAGIGDSLQDFLLNTWYHLAVCKKGNDIGIYVNGIQRRHYIRSSDYTFSVGTALWSGMRYAHGWGHYVSERIDDIFISRSNFFEANPNSGLTDTITVPTSPSSPTIVGDNILKANSDGKISRTAIVESDLHKMVVSESDGDWKKVIYIQYNPVIDKFKVVYEI